MLESSHPPAQMRISDCFRSLEGVREESQAALGLPVLLHSLKAAQACSQFELGKVVRPGLQVGEQPEWVLCKHSH